MSKALRNSFVLTSGVPLRRISNQSPLPSSSISVGLASKISARKGTGTSVSGRIAPRSSSSRELLSNVSHGGATKQRTNRSTDELLKTNSSPAATRLVTTSDGANKSPLSAAIRRPRGIATAPCACTNWSPYSSSSKAFSKATGSFIKRARSSKTLSLSGGLREKPSPIALALPARNRGVTPACLITAHHRMIFSPHCSGGIKLILVLLLWSVQAMVW